ncbi:MULTISPECIES: sugar synthetase [unclassified Meiothermus]|uniref:sugar synthetase n=1 Tax=unclassified Meiothermus TaxID=370471 RepID=UPI000D7C564D|nr:MULTISPECIES: sugar synthetase [unclassified Meiothermus]PZA06694.1 sugar synthetase [Meiothermus sp. Pnk-1]RYM36620.1 sugar synthetase [Meiothermus sp. PNK-Is4]
MDELLLLTNGPGELSTWVPPVVRRLRERLPKARLELFLIADQFASGQERQKARELPLDAVSGRRELLKRLVSPSRRGRGAVLMLGGAPRDAVLLARATGYPAFSYSFSGRGWHPRLRRFLVDSQRTQAEALRRGADPKRLQVVGNLVLDALAETRLAPYAEVDVLLFPGSRPFAARYLLGFMLRSAELMAQQEPGLRFAWVRSRLLPDVVVEEALAAQGSRAFGGVSARLQGGSLVSENGLEVRIVDEPLRYPAMRGAKLALTIPGTNTLEMALSGLPAVVLLPLHKPELIPLEGLLHWIGLLPGGGWLKRQAILRAEPRVAHLALPNQWLGERVYPELRGVFGPELAARVGLDLLSPQRQGWVRSRLQALEARPGADTLVEAILSEPS